eukprot:4428433-Pleurochrysis_carterae.AAC.4
MRCIRISRAVHGRDKYIVMKHKERAPDWCDGVQILEEARRVFGGLERYWPPTRPQVEVWHQLAESPI